MPLLLFFIIIPVIEIFLFIEIGSQIGTLWTVITVLGTAFLGTALVKKQGLQVLKNMQVNLQQNQIPIKELFSGICILIAGALLLTPGFLTDAIGFLLLFPLFRTTIGFKIIDFMKSSHKFKHFNMSGTSNFSDFHKHTSHQSHTHQHSPYQSNDETIIDGDFEIIDPDKQKQNSHKIKSISNPNDDPFKH